VLTTWILSYEQVWKQSKEAACLLKLWGFLDHGELWYELIVARRGLAQQMDILAWLVYIAEDELEFADAVGLLSRYSLADANEGTSSYSMHSVLHKWCGQLAEGEERYGLCCVAAELVASNVPSESEAKYWKKQKRVLAHGANVSGWIVNGPFSDAEETFGASILAWALHELGDLLSSGDRLKQAEEMYRRALQGYEKARGPEHTSTLDTVNNLGLLYAKQGRLDKAEKIYQRALQGKEKAWGPEHASTLDTVNNLGILYANQGRLDEAEKMYQRALQGKEKAWGPEHHYYCLN
jgi:tetratricopeptide (TPR) repeat protein